MSTFQIDHLKLWSYIFLASLNKQACYKLTVIKCKSIALLWRQFDYIDQNYYVYILWHNNFSSENLHIKSTDTFSKYV